MIDWIQLVYCFVVGACVGSFLNVCAYRIPRDISVVTPRSYCPACGTDIPWYFNIPTLSWFILRGKAACCGAKFSFRYAFIEILTGVIFALIWNKFGLPLSGVYWVFVSLLLVGMCTDFDHLIIPDRITLGGTVIGLALSVMIPATHCAPDAWESFNRSFIGATVGASTLWVIATAGTKLLKKEAMGMGDVKLMACIGAFLGWKATIFSIGLGSLIGSIAGLGWLLVAQKKWGSGVAVPFGPPLMLAAVLWLFGGEQWWNSYFAPFMQPPAP